MSPLNSFTDIKIEHKIKAINHDNLMVIMVMYKMILLKIVGDGSTCADFSSTLYGQKIHLREMYSFISYAMTEPSFTARLGNYC